jgi:hypothetical protein
MVLGQMLVLQMSSAIQVLQVVAVLAVPLHHSPQA